jgi:hypothetical protein
MANAKLDENSRPTLTALSSAGDGSIVDLYADPVLHRLLVETPVLTGSGAPSSTPTVIGEIYIDISTPHAYISTGTTNSSNWLIIG